MHPNSFFFFFPPTVCWKYATGFLDFYKGTLILGSNSVFSRGSQTTLKDESQFTGHCRVHSQDQGMYEYDLKHGGQQFMMVDVVWVPTTPKF